MISVGQKVLDFLLPPRCTGCKRQLERAGHLCPACFGEVDFISDPACLTCGVPFEFETSEFEISEAGAAGAPGSASSGPPGTVCAGCRADPPDCDRVRAAAEYGNITRRLILGLKNGAQDTALPLARLMAVHVQPASLDPPDVVIPVPLYIWRRVHRRYNQSALLADHIGQLTGLDVKLDLLERHKKTRTQKGLNRKERRNNVKGAFRVAARYKTWVKGRSFVLVDDVYTTGATVNACARVLKKAGAVRVSCLTAARSDGRQQAGTQEAGAAFWHKL